MKYNFITIEGNIGAGKTTLATLLSEHFKAKLILEEFADNPFLPKFYADPAQYAFPLELFFMAERYKQLKDMLQTKDMFQEVVISDYLFTKSLLFAKVNLADEEFRLYQKLFEIDGVPEETAREALRLGAMKLPITTRVVARIAD